MSARYNSHINQHPFAQAITTQRNDVVTNDEISNNDQIIGETTKDMQSLQLNDFNNDALQFRQVYEQTINDASKFTPHIQLKWCETLLEFAFNPNYIIQYTVNAERLNRPLNDIEMIKNQKIMVTHALKVLNKLTNLQYNKAFYLLGSLYSHKVTHFKLINYEFIEKNDSIALKNYQIGAELGDMDCCYRVGISFEYMKGTDLNLNIHDCLLNAIKFYQMGAELGNVDCMFRLGNLLVECPKDTSLRNLNTGIFWYQEASRLGNNHACFALGQIYEFNNLNESLQDALLINDKIMVPDYEKSLKYYYNCATKFNYSIAQWRIGHCYEFGEMGLPVNGMKAMAWYYQSSLMDGKRSINAMGMLGIAGFYFTGIRNILNSNYQESFKWLLKANEVSRGKIPRIDFALGKYYEMGIGCPIDINRSQFHYERAAKNGLFKD